MIFNSRLERKKFTCQLEFSTIKDKNIEIVKSTKFLGIRIDEHMTWKTHISYITNKISKLSGVSINLLAFYHKCRSLIGYATQVLFCDR